ncbi:hypothetical protein BD779DRAFT_1241309 [Infundibulicybe gibba]|nr:hypothetical protein BD779DRAFT_1241309 [Infundibulicybe gibba]
MCCCQSRFNPECHWHPTERHHIALRRNSTRYHHHERLNITDSMDQNRRLPTPLAMNAIPHGDQIMSNTESVPMGENPPKTKSFTFPSRTAARPQNSIKPAAQSKGGVRETPRVSAAEEENIELEKELTRVKQELMQLKEKLSSFLTGYMEAY